MLVYDGTAKPQIRPVQAYPVEQDGETAFVLVDPSGWAEATITVNREALFLLGMFDGVHSLDDIRAGYLAQFGKLMPSETLASVVEGLRQARLLGGADFLGYYNELLEAYRAAPTRPVQYAQSFESPEQLKSDIAEMLAQGERVESSGRRVRGIVAPHLDYPRGGPCYAAAYAQLVNTPAPKRVIILGTNHFGMSASVSATGKAFESPYGTTQVDVDFLERLEARCGDLRSHELDHAREHSIELQVLICQHIWGSDAFKIVPALCPDPCGPTGTAPWSGEGVDLADFASALRDVLSEHDDPSLVIAGADLSHFGREFGDDRDLDDVFCREVEERDQAALVHVAANGPTDFVATVARNENPTRVCSAGCIFTAMQALDDAKVEVLRYHQTVDPETQTAVSCAAAVFYN
ncbi:MAG TPA: AmmeMemoRadiSam system protein B [Phycisphaerae bacterium]|nr:AmmeMemoRadiSam system protein B [Phycisphaerae bacterium]